MKKLVLSIVILLSVFNYFSFSQTDHVVIAEVFAGGGNGGAPYLYDYMVLYNPTGSSVDVSGWSLQYSTTVFPSLTVYQKTDLVGSIPAGSYYLIQFAGAILANGIPLPYYPDVINSSISLQKGVGKVALVNNQTTLSADPTLPDANIIDFVGYGAADVWEGTSRYVNALGDQSGIRRRTNSGSNVYNYGSDGSGQDTDDNAADFYKQNQLLEIPNHPLSSSPLANHVVIAEVYGGGGATGTYRYDYVTLYNSSTSAQDLSTWSLQYYNGSTWTVENLSGSISSLNYFLIQLGDGGSGNPLPITPDVVGSTDIGMTNGQVALVRNQVALSGANPLTVNGFIMDFVGYGTVTGYEGTVGPATSPGLTTSIRRKDNNGANTYGANGSGWDSNDNSGNHYTQGSPVPLPVELVSFTATAIENEVKLEWRTETEVNNYGFEIYKTTDVKNNDFVNWQNIGFIEGYGNSNSPKLYTFIDDKTNNTSSIAYRLKQVDNDGKYEYSSIVEVSLIPNEIALYQNFPNPFNPTTKIKYSIAKETGVNIKIFDNIGNEVSTILDENQAAGNYEINFTANNLASGVYFYRLQAGDFVQLKKMMILK